MYQFNWTYSPSKIFYENKDSFDKQPMDMFPGWAKRMAELQINAYSTQYKLKNISIVGLRIFMVQVITLTQIMLWSFHQ